MENEFTITAELLSFGGYTELFVIPFKKSFQVFLDDSEIGVLAKNREDEWMDLTGNLDTYSIKIIGEQLNEYQELKTYYKNAG